MSRKGWVGIYLYMISGYEQKAIRKFLKTLPAGSHKAQNFEDPEYCDEYHDDLGYFYCPQRTYLFETAELRERFVEFLKTIPKREKTIRIAAHRLDDDLFSLLKGENFYVASSHREDAIISITNDLPKPVHVMIKLKYC
jgi:hypothetical protein